MIRRKQTPEKNEAAKREKEHFNFSIFTFRSRIKGGFACRKLAKLEPQVNLLWNDCNATLYDAIRNHRKWISQTHFQGLVKGTSKELDINSQMIQAIRTKYVTRRIQFKKRKLRWRRRGSRNFLGRIRFNEQIASLERSEIYYKGEYYKFGNSWNSRNSHQRKIKRKVKSGSLSQDARSHWYPNVTCKVLVLKNKYTVELVGINVGVKTSALLIDGAVIENNSAHRANKKRQVKDIHASIQNRRKDSLHKETTKVGKKCHSAFVGDVSGKFVQSRNGKSSADENFSTIICSHCFEKIGPSGLSDLEVRGSICSECQSRHDQGINAAKSILRFGRESLRVANAA